MMNDFLIKFFSNNSFNSELTELFAGWLAKVPPDIILVIIVLIILIFFIYGSSRLICISKLTSRLQKETKKIKAAEFLDFEKICLSLPALKPLFEEFQELMTEPGRNTENCEIILTEDNVLRAIGVDETALEHYPGVFTALGIAGTFIGILFALFPMKDAGIHDELISNILRGAGTAFLTSVIGIIASLIFLTFERRIIGNFKKQLYDFQMIINNKLKRMTTEELLYQIKGVLDLPTKDDFSEIKDALSTMADDIGSAVSKSITETLASVSNVLEKSVATAGNSSQEIVNNVMGSIDGTLRRFSESLDKMEQGSSVQADILKHFDDSVRNTGTMVDKLRGVIPNMLEISQNFEVSSQRLDKLPVALNGLIQVQKEFSEVVQQSIELMNENWQAERERLTELIETLQKQFTSFEDGIVNGLQIAMSKFDDELSRAGTYVATWLDRLHGDVDNFTKQISNFNGIFQNSSSDIQTTLHTFVQSLTKQSTAMQTDVASINTALKDGLREIENSLKPFPQSLQESIVGIEKIYKIATEQLPEKLTKHFEYIANELSNKPRRGFGGIFGNK